MFDCSQRPTNLGKKTSIRVAYYLVLLYNIAVQRKYVYFTTIKNIDQHIEVDRQVNQIFKRHRCQLINDWWLKDFPYDLDIVDRRIESQLSDAQSDLGQAEFAVVDFSIKSRWAFFKSMLAVQKKIPLLCVVKNDQLDNVPEMIRTSQSGLMTVASYDSLEDLEPQIKRFLKQTGTLKKRFNIMLNTTSLKQLETLSEELEIPKADVVRSLIADHYKHISQKTKN